MKRGLFCTLLSVLLLGCLFFLPTEAQAADAENLIFVANSNASYSLERCNTSAAGELVIPATHNGYPVTAIGDFAFADCTGLTTVVIPDGITSIGLGAFSDCTGLTQITIPNSVVSVGIYAFDGCTSLGYNTYGNAKYLGNESNPYVLLTDAASTGVTSCQIHADTRSIYFEAFKGCTKLTHITIPDSVAAIGNYAFDGCTGLQNIHLGKGMTVIGEAAFRGCAGLTDITIPNSVTAIGMSAFSGCTGLTDLTIPNRVTEIGWYAFSGCTGLTEITIPSSVTSVGKYAFNGCSALQKVFFGGTCAEWKALTARGGDAAGATVVTGAHSYEGVVTKEATCVSEGVMTYVCSGCGDTKAETEKIPLAGHSYGEWTEVKAPTAEEVGTEERNCIHCNAKEQREIAKLEVIPTEPTEPSAEPTEPPTEPSVQNPTEPTIGDSGENPPKNDDNSVIWIAVIGVAGLLAAAAAVVLKKRKN